MVGFEPYHSLVAARQTFLKQTLAFQPTCLRANPGSSLLPHDLDTIHPHDPTDQLLLCSSTSLQLILDQRMILVLATVA